MLRSMMGGATNRQAIALSDSGVKARVMADLKNIMGIDAEPDFMRIFHHQRAIPQYTVGHAKRLLAIEERTRKVPGLILTGNALFGVGLNDCVNASNKAAAQVVAQLKK